MYGFGGEHGLVAFATPGPRLMWQFGELGYGGGPGECLVSDGVTCPPGTPGRISAKPIRWDYYAPGVQPTRALVFGNFGVAPAQINIISPEAVTWYDYFGDTAQSFAAVVQTLTLAPGEFHVWTNTDVPSPEPGIATPDEAGAPGASGLALAAFPNPAVGTATVRFSLDAAQTVRLEALDVLGRRVAVLVDGPRGAGPHTVALDTRRLPAGVYVLRLVAGAETRTARLTVAR